MNEAYDDNGPYLLESNAKLVQVVDDIVDLPVRMLCSCLNETRIIPQTGKIIKW